MAVAKKKASGFNDLTKCHFNEDEGVYITAKGRGMFVALAEKFVGKNDKDDSGRFSLELMFMSDRDLSVLYEAANECAADNGFQIDFSEQTPGKEFTVTSKGKKTKFRNPFLASDELYDGVTSKGDDVDLDGAITIRCNAKKHRPKVRDASGAEMDVDDIEAACYSGRWYRAMLKPYFYPADKGQGKAGVSFGLEAVQVLGEDDTYGGGGPSTDGSAFGAVDDEDDDAPKTKKSAGKAGNKAGSKKRPVEDDEDEV